MGKAANIVMSWFKPVLPAFNPVLVNGDVMLRAPRPGDHSSWASLRTNSQAHLTAWEDIWDENATGRKAYWRRLRLYRRAAREGQGLYLFVFRRSDEAMVGSATLSNIRYGAARTATLSYWVGTPFVRRGYGSAAVDALCRHGFETLKLNRIEAACQAENLPSKALLNRCGFAMEGIGRDYLRINDVLRDHELYALTAREFRSCSKAGNQ